MNDSRWYKSPASRSFPAASDTATVTVTGGQVTTVGLAFSSPSFTFGHMKGRVCTQEFLPVNGAAVRMFDVQGSSSPR